MWSSPVPNPALAAALHQSSLKNTVSMAATTTISAPESGSLTDRLINQIRSSSNDRKPHKKCQLIEDYLSKTIYESDDDFGWVDCDILPYSNSTFVSLALRHLSTNLYEFQGRKKRFYGKVAAVADSHFRSNAVTTKGILRNPKYFGIK